MSETTLIVPFNSTDTEDQSSLDLNITMAQEPIPETSKTAQPGDLMSMWNIAINGDSAYKYISDNCPYAVLAEKVLTVTLKFYVYPSVMSLPYRLSTTLGTITGGVRTTQQRSFDVLMNGTDTLQLDSVAGGSLSTQMPIFSKDGEEIYPEISMEDGVITSTEPCYTSLRFDGQVSCFEHELIFQVVLSGGSSTNPQNETKAESITNLKITITAEWVDEHGESQKTTLAMEIPPCVADILSVCPDDVPDSTTSSDDHTEDRLIVYYNTCTGDVIKEVVVEPK